MHLYHLQHRYFAPIRRLNDCFAHPDAVALCHRHSGIQDQICSRGRIPIANIVRFDIFYGKIEKIPPGAVQVEQAAFQVRYGDIVGSSFEDLQQSRSLLLRDPEEVDRQLARLRRLCERIERDRRPYTPINGILLVIPAAAGASDAAAREVATLCQRDLDAVREQLQVDCPVVALVCDVEQIPGFADFVSFYPEGQRKRFLGQQFPLVPDLDAAGKVRMVERGVQWVANVQFPGLVYKNWEPESVGPAEVAPDRSANVRLYRFFSELRERQRRIGRVLTRGVLMPNGGRTMLAGCGFAATGRDIVREQGFASGAFRLLVENQNHVAWTPDAVESDADFHRLTRIGYVGMTVLVVALVVLGYLLWPHNG